MSEEEAVFDNVFCNDLTQLTIKNKYYRKVISTTPNMQLVLMCLQPYTEIGMEIHPYNTQFIKIETGEGTAIIDNISYDLYDGIGIFVPLNTYHNIINNSSKMLKLYTIYSPPHHNYNTVEK